jgi:3-phenylpropionate/cinnamic acid dioxygenase small subunit
VEKDDDGMSVVTETGISLQEAAEFIWREADILDDLAYREWLKLWTADGLYIVPIDRDAEDHAAALNVLYDDQGMREARVKRLLSGFSMSSAPPARTVRTVSRFRTLEADADSITLRAAQHLVEYKYERTRVLAADVTYRLVRTAGGLALDRKIVQLINSDDALFGIGYLL